MAKKESLDRILDAADRVLARNGLAATTLEAVAAEAGVSKGGILHYFRNKSDLLLAGLVRFEERYFARRDQVIESLPDTPCRLARATLMTIADFRYQLGHAGHYRIDMLQDLRFRTQIGDMKRRLHSDIFKGARHPEKMLAAMYMMDGLWLCSLFTPSPIPASVEKKARKWLAKYIEDSFGDFE